MLRGMGPGMPCGLGQGDAMPLTDRDGFIRLLERLGSPDEAELVAAARELDRRVAAAGLDWDELILGAPSADPEGVASAEGEPLPPETDIDALGDDALIDRILREYPVSETTRADLVDFKTDIAAGEFSASDRRYLRSLYTRLRSGRTAAG